MMCMMFVCNSAFAQTQAPNLQMTYPQANTKVTEIPDNIIFMFDQEVTGVDAAAIQSGYNDPIMLEESNIKIVDGNCVYLNVAAVKSQIAAGNVTAFVALSGVEDFYETNFTLGAEFGVVSSDLGAKGGTVTFSNSVDFVDYATSGEATVFNAATQQKAADATLTLDDNEYDVVVVEFDTELADGSYILNIPAETIMDITGEEYAGGDIEFTVGTTGISVINITKAATSKVIENGQVVIVKNGVKYNVLGQPVK